MEKDSLIIYLCTIAALFSSSCGLNDEQSSYGVGSQQVVSADTTKIIFQNNNLVIKSRNNDVPDIYSKFTPFIHFSDFPVEEIHNEAKAELQLGKESDFWDFRTRIRNGYADNVKFAGKYCFVVWGCGSSCQMAVIIDVTTGEIYACPQATQGYKYQLNSRMLIVNPPQEDVQFENGETSPALWLNCDYCQPEIYIWNEDLKIFEERKPMFY